MDPPVPIPNTEVKRYSAHDTAPAKVWENRSLPGDYFLKRLIERWGVSCIYGVLAESKDRSIPPALIRSRTHFFRHKKERNGHQVQTLHRQIWGSVKSLLPDLRSRGGVQAVSNAGPGTELIFDGQTECSAECLAAKRNQQRCDIRLLLRPPPR